MLEWLLFIFYLLPCLHLPISWQFSLREITLHTRHGWWFRRPKQDVPSTEFQLIHLRDFLHLIERSVKQISLAARSKNRSGKNTAFRTDVPDVGVGGTLFFLSGDYCRRNWSARVRARSGRMRAGRLFGQQPAYTHCLFWTRHRLIYTC